MSQPKAQLEVFRAWAGLDSDISYYLNTHHIDLHAWMMAGRGRPITVSSSAAQGFAQRILDREVEDTIALKVDWENLPSGHRGVAIYNIIMDCTPCRGSLPAAVFLPRPSRRDCR